MVCCSARMISFSAAMIPRRSFAFRSVSLPPLVWALKRSSTRSNFSCATPITISPKSEAKRRYASKANRKSPVCSANPCTVSSLRPRFRTVSIMPGIENAAPDRTETSSGLLASPNFFPTFCSTSCRAAVTWSHMPSGNCLPFA